MKPFWFLILFIEEEIIRLEIIFAELFVMKEHATSDLEYLRDLSAYEETLWQEISVIEWKHSERMDKAFISVNACLNVHIMSGSHKHLLGSFEKFSDIKLPFFH